MLRRWAEQVGDEASRDMLDELRVAAPLGETGDTVRGLEVVPAGGGDRMAWWVRSKSPHGDYVEEGTPPHVILPRTAKVLRFLGGTGRISQPSPNQRIPTRAGGVVFATQVNHPGTPARPWFHPLVDRWADYLQRAAARVVAR